MDKLYLSYKEIQMETIAYVLSRMATLIPIARLQGVTVNLDVQGFTTGVVVTVSVWKGLTFSMADSAPAFRATFDSALSEDEDTLCRLIELEAIIEHLGSK